MTRLNREAMGIEEGEDETTPEESPAPGQPEPEPEPSE